VCFALGVTAAPTVTTNYDVSGDPLTQSVTDSTGTITSVGNLLGQTVSYTDVWGTVTTPTYNLHRDIPRQPCHPSSEFRDCCGRRGGLQRRNCMDTVTYDRRFLHE
jgi:hypothetical protein